MSFLPHFQFHIFGGWWFSALFFIIHLIIGFIHPQFRAKALVRPKGDSRVQSVTMIMTMLLFQSRIVLSVFMPVHFGTPFFFAGTALYSSGLVCYFTALITFVRHPEDSPVTVGMYRLTRNPQQIFAALLWNGAGLMMGSVLFMMLGIAELFLAYPGFRAQEKFCIDKFGDSYTQYMRKTPRYLFRLRRERA
jgi:protein-S-isoprenylcysteine O-methyltransferase Ste14